jgi:beta-N-acetylhexosaminidase
MVRKRRWVWRLVLLVWISGLLVGNVIPAAAAPAAQKPGPTLPAEVRALSAKAQAVLAMMSPAERVGQLFVVTYQGNDLSDSSPIATLVRDYRVGGVVLLPENDNFRDQPVTIDEAGSTQTLSTPQQIVRLTNRMQALAQGAARPISSTVALTTTPTARATTVRPAAAPPAGSPVHLPLLIGLDWSGDDSTLFSGSGGFTPLPSTMAMGATWTPPLAEKVGQIMGKEMGAVGVNLLLGPNLDVLDAPRPGGAGDLRTRSFGGDPYWVGQMGQAIIRGIQSGSSSEVATAARHFPGQGGSDRRPDDEVATVQKSVQQLRQIELAPFATVASGMDLSAAGVTPILMTSHIRYRGFQGNIRQLTPPISLAPQLQDLMALKEFTDWRTGGGVLMSDALGVPALRRYYDPQLQKFPHRQVAQDAFLAGNDLLYLSRFALTDNWPDQYQAIKETVLFFQDKYASDAEFRARVDASAERIIRLKQRLYHGQWKQDDLVQGFTQLTESVGKGSAVTSSVARAGLSLIYPGRDELADRLPSAPLPDENILIFTDARETRECASCQLAPLIQATAIQNIILRLYGPAATGQVQANRVRSMTYADLNRYLTSPTDRDPGVGEAIASAQWIIFAQLDYNPEQFPDSAALRTFLAKRSDSARDKRLVVMAFEAPYYLDTTEISKLTAYYGLYARTAPFLETAVRALFREFSPVGAPPVSITGINYQLINQVEPAPAQIIPLGPVGAASTVSGKPASIQVGSTIELETGTILDRNGHPVPDGTPVEFHLRYPAEALQLAPALETTVAGRGRTKVPLDRAGELWITVQSGEARNSTLIVLKVGGDAPGSIATVLPSPTLPPTNTTTPLPRPSPTIEPSPTPSTTPAAPAPPPAPPAGQALASFLFGLGGIVVSSSTAYGIRSRWPGQRRTLRRAVVSGALGAALWAACLGWLAYLLYMFGWLPGVNVLPAAGEDWLAGILSFAGGILSLLWAGPASHTGWERER